MRKFILPAAALLVAALAFASFSSAKEEKAAAGVNPGGAAPAISLPDTAGKTHSLADQNGKVVVIEWINPGCPFVERHYNLKTMTGLAAKNKDVTWLAIATGKTANAEELKAFAKKYEIGYPILLDSDGSVARAYGATNTPHMFIVDKGGKIAYAGAIDSEPSDDVKAALKDGTVNHVEKALGEIAKGETVSNPKTVAYGCGVKFK